MECHWVSLRGVSSTFKTLAPCWRPVVKQHHIWHLHFRDLLQEVPNESGCMQQLLLFPNLINSSRSFREGSKLFIYEAGKSSTSIRLFVYTYIAGYIGNARPWHAGVHKNINCLWDFFSSDKLSKKVRDIKFWKYHSLVRFDDFIVKICFIWPH